MLRLIAATLAISMALRGPPSPKYAAEPEEGKSWVDSYPAIDDDDIDWDQDKYQKAVMAVEEAEDMDGEKYQKEEAEDMDGEKYQKAVEEADGTMLVEEDKIVDVTQAFSKGVFTDANQQRYRCCKLWKNDWGIVVPEKTGKKEPLLSGCKGLLGIFYKSFNQYKEGNCTVFKSALPTALSKQDFPVRHRVMGKVRVQQHPGSFWHLRVAVVESRNDHYLKNVRVQAISTGDNPYFQDGKVSLGVEKTDYNGEVNFKLPYGSYTVRLRVLDVKRVPAGDLIYNKTETCTDTDECATLIAFHKL